MKRGLKITTAIALSLMCMLTACKKPKDPTPPQDEIYNKYDYTATHEAKNNLLNFKSSDSGLDIFLNDFFERHMRDTDKRIHTHPVGRGSSSWKEWEAIIGSWWDASYRFNKSMTSMYATKDAVTDWLLTPKQDNQGYIWCDDGSTPSSWELGWAFPNYLNGGIGYEFDKSIEGWTGGGANDMITRTDALLPGDGSREITVSNSNTDFITAISPDITISGFNAPFIKMGWGYKNIGDAENVDDLYIYFQNKGDADFSEDKKVKYSDFCITGEKISGDVNYNLACFPMYLNKDWGREETKQIQKIKVVLKAKPGKTVTGNLRIDFLRMECDDRQANNLGNYIIASDSILSYAQDPALMNLIIPKARRAMQNYLSVLDGYNGLMSTNYHVGHDAQGIKMPGYGIADGYWDVTSYPDVNIYTNLVYYRALKAMISLENMVKDYDLKLPESQIVDKNMKNKITYKETLASLNILEAKTRTDFQTYFWNEKTGRFNGGYYGGDKRHVQDNGYLMFNLEAVSAGLATTEQAMSIMKWVNGDREISIDDSKGKDIYEFEFAPRNTTKQNLADYVWIYGGCPFGTGVHNGGAVMQTSYYDLDARVKVLGADNGYERLKAIQTWYEKVVAEGGVGGEFYRKYYKKIGISMQGGPTGGSVGLDYEFLEAALMFSAMPKAFFGIEPATNKTLNITPNMPSKLDYWKMENLSYANIYYDVSISKYFVDIASVRDKAGKDTKLNGFNICVKLNKPKFNFDVIHNGKKVEYKEKDGKIIVNIPFENGRVEIISK